MLILFPEESPQISTQAATSLIGRPFLEECIRKIWKKLKIKQSTGVRIYLWCQLEPLVKKFIDEIPRLLNPWTNGTPLKYTALKAIHVMHALLLQKPS